jgi:ankyrin repeat protein
MSHEYPKECDSEVTGLRFAEAIWTSDHEKLTSLLAEGHNPNMATPGGLPPLFLACKKANPQMIATLLHYGAEPNVEVEASFPLTFLLSDGAWSPFMQQRWDCVRLLLLSEANVELKCSHGYSPMEAAWESGHGEALVRLMLELELKPNLPSIEIRLISAVKRKQIRLAQSLLVLKVNPNCRALTDIAGATPLMLAAAHGDYDMAQLLISFGANPRLKTIRNQIRHVRNPLSKQNFTPESTALEFSIIRGVYRVVQLLLVASGKSTSNLPSDARLLELALKMSRDDLVQLLQEHRYCSFETTRGSVVPFERKKAARAVR